MNADTPANLDLVWLQAPIYLVHLAPHCNNALRVADDKDICTRVCHKMLAHRLRSSGLNDPLMLVFYLGVMPDSATITVMALACSLVAPLSTLCCLILCPCCRA